MGSDTRFIIYRQEGSNYFALNDQSNGAKNAQFYKYTDKPADSFVKWIFYDSAGSQTTQESKQSQVAKRTSNAKYTSLQWTSLSNSSIPTVTIPETEHIKHIGKYFTLTINGVVYRNYYIELTAKYDSEISDFWPGNALSDYGSYKFGSWATGYNTPYRQRFTDHANIVGLYPYLEKQLINDRSDSAHPYDLAEIMDAALQFTDLHNRQLMIEYLLVADKDGNLLNATNECAEQLSDLVHGKNCMVNLIPWNTVAEREFTAPSGNAVHRFQDVLIKNGIHARIRRERGTDIGSACGQLRIKRKN